MSDIETRARELLAKHSEDYAKPGTARMESVGFVATVQSTDALAALTEALTRIEELEGARHTALRPIGWQDVRLAVGEGKLTNNDVLDGVNAELRRRATLTKGIKE